MVGVDEILAGEAPAFARAVRAIITGDVAALRAELAAAPARNVVHGCVTVDDASFAERAREHRTAPERHPDDDVIARARASLDFEHCRTACPKAADPAACPFHNEEALAYWSPDNLNRWARMHCPQKTAVVQHFRVARIY